MNEVEVIATFDTPQTARLGAKLLNSWFYWIMEGSNDETEEIEELFEDFGLSFEEYSIDRDTDVDWDEIPDAHLEGNKIIVGLNSRTGIDAIRGLFEAMGGDVYISGEDD